MLRPSTFTTRMILARQNQMVFIQASMQQRAFMNMYQDPAAASSLQFNSEIMDQALKLDEMEDETDTLNLKGRNSRKPKKANHGARPCSSYMRKLKIKGYYHKLRAKD